MTTEFARPPVVRGNRSVHARKHFLGPHAVERNQDDVAIVRAGDHCREQETADQRDVRSRDVSRSQPLRRYLVAIDVESHRRSILSQPP